MEQPRNSLLPGFTNPFWMRRRKVSLFRSHEDIMKPNETKINVYNFSLKFQITFKVENTMYYYTILYCMFLGLFRNWCIHLSIQSWDHWVGYFQFSEKITFQIIPPNPVVSRLINTNYHNFTQELNWILWRKTKTKSSLQSFRKPVGKSM